MYILYRSLTCTLSPFIPLLLKRRLKKGKEEAARIGERTGNYLLPRPPGTLIWVHAASVGETNSVLPLIKRLLADFPSVCILLTTVTVTSARLVEGKLPAGALHQFAPVDTPEAVRKFLRHWQPAVALWVDSELWPNMLIETQKSGAIMGLVNARMSPRSFAKWNYAPRFAKRLLSCFSLCFSQSEEDSRYLLALGIGRINAVCNLKYDAPPLSCNDDELAALKQLTRDRPVWLASSTHPGEETIIADVHRQLTPYFPTLLTVIVPRHAKRGNEIRNQLQEYGTIAQRSRQQAITADTHFYIADTMGELGLFYRLAPIVFIGGTLVPHGGQNALEAARIGCAIITGKHYHNFIRVVDDMAAEHAIVKITTPDDLVRAVRELFENPAKREDLIQAGRRHAESRGGAIDRIVNALRAYI